MMAELVHTICGKPIADPERMPMRYPEDPDEIWLLKCKHCDAEFTSNDTGEYDYV